MKQVPPKPCQRILVVGQGNTAWIPRLGPLPKGLSVDYPDISSAMDAIPTRYGSGAGADWTIWVLPGRYKEEVRMKPNVSILGFDYGSVILEPPGPSVKRFSDGSGRRALVYLNQNTSVSNLVVWKAAGAWEENDYAFWNKDTYGLPAPLPSDWTSDPKIAAALNGQGVTRASPSQLGLTNVAIWPAPYEAGVKGKALLMEGAWKTALFTNFLSSYNVGSGYDIELRGVGLIQDCHFMQCFFDAMFVEEDGGGCMLLDNIHDVNIRNSLLRANAPTGWRRVTPDGYDLNFPGACVAARGQAELSLQGTSLESGWTSADRLLDLGPGTECTARYSSIDSVYLRRSQSLPEGRLIYPRTREAHAIEP